MKCPLVESSNTNRRGFSNFTIDRKRPANIILLRLLKKTVKKSIYKIRQLKQLLLCKSDFGAKDKVNYRTVQKLIEPHNLRLLRERSGTNTAAYPERIQHFE